MKIVLASASPRRRELLSRLVPDFLIEPSQFEEIAGTDAENTALTLAMGKAEEVFSRFPDSLVLGADTVVALEGRVLGKPKTAEEAYAMLKALSGKEHSVYTGVCLVAKGVRKECVVETKVVFNELSDEFIWDYIAAGSPFDKAGGYGIQDGGLVKSFEGSYTNVVGLPLERVEEMLRELGGIS